MTDRWDLTEADDPSVFPIQIYKGGFHHNFCPAKAAWPGPDSVVHKFKTLIFAASSKTMLVGGGIMEQPAWFVETMSWFLPLYDQVIWMTRVRSLFGSGKMKRSVNQGRAAHGSRRLHR